MAENGSKKKPAKAKAKPQESGVLGALPSTRPSRMSRHSRDTVTPAVAAKPKARKAAAKRKPAAKAAPKVQAPQQPPATVTEVTDAPRTRPRPVRAGSHKLADSAKKSAGRRAPAPSKAPSGTELITTVVQAAGELAQVGLTVSGQILKRAVEKLPKP
jgi:hypothetical protein